MDYYLFSFETKSEEQKELLIAQLGNIGFVGFEELELLLRAYIEVPDFNQDEFEIIMKSTDLKYLRSIIKKTNWNVVWESGFEPVIIYDPATKFPLVYIRANFHPAVEEVMYDLLITPKMSFGTGHHATTYQMIEQMTMLDFNKKTVIDFGTGTGVLAIFAEKLGASKITAIDNDYCCIENARENIETNGCSNITLLKAQTISCDKKADVVLANINLNIILSNLELIMAACNPEADILFSGILAADEPAILEALNKSGMLVKSIFTKDNWLIIIAKSPSTYYPQ